MRLTAADHGQVAAAIRAAEATTDGEVAVIVAHASDAYHDAVLHYALLVALLPLAAAAVWPTLLVHVAAFFTGGWEAPPMHLQLGLLLAATILFFLLARLLFGLPRLRFALVPAATRTRRVRRRAIELFRTGTEARTLSRTGVLLYLSLAERHAEIVADAAIHARAGGEAWGEAMAALLAGVRDGRPGDGMAHAVERIGAVLATHFPHTGGDPNELPDRLIEL